MRNPGQVFTRDQLLEKVWGYDYAGETRTVDVHVHWLRAELEEDPAAPELLQTVRGVGYVFRRPRPDRGSGNRGAISREGETTTRREALARTTIIAAPATSPSAQRETRIRAAATATALASPPATAASTAPTIPGIVVKPCAIACSGLRSRLRRPVGADDAGEVVVATLRDVRVQPGDHLEVRVAQPVHGLQGAEILAARARQPAERGEADEQVEPQHRDHDEREVGAARCRPAPGTRAPRATPRGT